MRVAWIQDLPLGQGGASKTDEVIVWEGIRRGHHIHVVLPRTEISEADLTIISNAIAFPEDVLLKLKPRVVFLHDYWPLCKWRLLFPLKESCKACEQMEYARKLIGEAECVFWMSPMHRETWLKVLPELDEKRHALIPSAFSRSQVEELKQLRNSLPDESTVLGVNSLLPYKGRDLVLKYAEKHPDLRFTFVGASEGVSHLPSNCRFLGPQTWKSLLHMYATHEAVIHMPMLDPCSRVAVEAILSGKRLIANKCVGLMSFFNYEPPSSEKVEELVLNSAKKFWIKVEEVME